MITELMYKTGMGVLLLVAIPNGDVPGAGVWAQWGLAGLVVCYTLWRDNARECRLGASLEEHQKWMRDVFIEAIQKNTSALDRIINGKK